MRRLLYLNRYMLKDNECYFIALASEQEDGAYIIPIKFNTRDYSEALQLVQCVTDDKPERKLFIANDAGVIDHVWRRKYG